MWGAQSPWHFEEETRIGGRSGFSGATDSGRVTLGFVAGQRFSPRVVRGNSFWGTQLDTLDVTSVVRYRLVEES